MGGFNQPKTLSGIETGDPSWMPLRPITCFNQPKTLSGIETKGLRMEDPDPLASTNPKPFQGLKQ